MTGNEAGRKIEELLPRLYALRVELDRIEEPSAGDRTKPFPPAAEAEIAAAEKRRGCSFPPGYRTFLGMHNGWRNFSYDWAVIGISGPGWEKASKEWAKDCAKFERSCQRKGPKFVAELREKARTDPSLMYWPDHVPVAVDYNGGFRVLDLNRLQPDGEYEIAEVYAGSMEAINREPGFLAVCELAMQIARRELAGHGRKPDAIEATATKEALVAAAQGGGTGGSVQTAKGNISKPKPKPPARKSAKAKTPASRGGKPSGKKKSMKRRK